MAISLDEANFSTGDDVSAYRDIYFKLTSDDGDIVNIALDLENVTDGITIPIRKPADFGTSDEFTFRVHEICQDYLSGDSGYMSVGSPVNPNPAANSIKLFQIKSSTKEEVLSGGLIVDGATWGGTLTWYAHHTTINKFLHPHIAAITLSDYINTGTGQSALFLTNKRTAQQHIGYSTRKMALQFITRAISPPPDMRIRTYNGSTLLNTYDETITSVPAGRWEVLVGIDSMVSLIGGSFTTDLATMTRYIITLADTDPGYTTYSEDYQIDILKGCSFFSIHYLNPLGAFDVKFIDSPPNYASEIERNFFDGVSYDSDDNTRIKTSVMNTTSRHMIDIVTKPDTDAGMKEWREIVESPEIYIQFIDSDNFIRYHIADDEFQLQGDRQTRNTFSLTLISSEENPILR